MCEHPQINWIGKSDGIHCGICGQLINFGTPKKEEPKPEPETMPEPVVDPDPVSEEPKPKRKTALKKGGKK